MGANFDMDRSVLEPKMRIRSRHVALHLLPRPEVELKAKWVLGYRNMALDLRYRVPVDGVGKFWDGARGARILINLFQMPGSGLHLTPGGEDGSTGGWGVGRLGLEEAKWDWSWQNRVGCGKIRSPWGNIGVLQCGGFKVVGIREFSRIFESEITRKWNKN